MQLRSFGRKLLSNVHSSNALRSKAIFRSNTLKCHYSSILSPLVDLLRPNHSGIITEEQNLLTSLLSCLRSIDASKEEIDLIYDTRSRMSDLFLIVIVGEFNSGMTGHYSVYLPSFFSRRTQVIAITKY
jgi:hypothetical protein